MQHHILLSLILLSFRRASLRLPESTQLALALKQLDGVKNPLERAEQRQCRLTVALFLRLLTGAAGFTTVEQASAATLPSKGAAACRQP